MIRDVPNSQSSAFTDSLSSFRIHAAASTSIYPIGLSAQRSIHLRPDSRSSLSNRSDLSNHRVGLVNLCKARQVQCMLCFISVSSVYLLAL